MRKLLIVLLCINNYTFSQKANDWFGTIKNTELIVEGKLLHKKLVKAKDIGCDKCDNYIVRYILVEKVIKGDKRLENDVIRTFEHYYSNKDRFDPPQPFYKNESANGIFLILSYGTNKGYPNKFEDYYTTEVNGKLRFSNEIGTDESKDLLEHYNATHGIPAFDTIFSNKDDLIKYIENSLKEVEPKK